MVLGLSTKKINTSIYIPAGRSMITLLTDQLPVLFSNPDGELPVLDYCTKSYVHRILSRRPELASGLQGLLNHVIENHSRDMYVSLSEHMLCLIKRIIKGEYVFDNGEERLKINNSSYVKINYASSGQQETVWMLNLLFYYLLSPRKCMIIVEEPEAHLYPDSQKYMAEALALFVKAGNKLIVTTHSPYILGEFNNLLYADEIIVNSEERR